MPNEKISDDLKSWPRHQEYSLPLAWAGSIVTLARQEGRIPNDKLLKRLQEELDNFRTQCSILSGYDWFINPLVYTKVFFLYLFQKEETNFKMFTAIASIYFCFSLVCSPGGDFYRVLFLCGRVDGAAADWSSDRVAHTFFLYFSFGHSVFILHVLFQ